MKFITLKGTDNKLVFLNPDYIAVMTTEEDKYDDDSTMVYTSIRMSDGTTIVNVLEPAGEIMSKIIVASF